MRAIAVLCVVVVHSAVAGAAISSSFGGRLLAHLNVGVTIFFLISGFLLYRPFLAGRQRGGPPAPGVAEYGKRRFLRIYPAYWLILTVLVVVPGLTAVIGGHWLPMYAIAHTLPVYDGTRCVDAPFECGLGHTWSLVVEVTFYAALPVYALAAAWVFRRLTPRAAFYAELSVLALLAAVSVLLQFVILDPAPAWFARCAWCALGGRRAPEGSVRRCRSPSPAARSSLAEAASCRRSVRTATYRSIGHFAQRPGCGPRTA